MVDLEGNVAAAVSSGGLAMKHPGRIGQVVRHAVFVFFVKVTSLYVIFWHCKVESAILTCPVNA